MKKQILLFIMLLPLVFSSAVKAELYTDGFVQGLFGGRLDSDNPTVNEQTVNETRFQLRMEKFGDGSEFFSRLDFVYDGVGREEYTWEMREAYFKFRLGEKIDVKIGRQILTWGTGDLIFINDVFAKDYRSFFIGRDDQYLKAPQNALRFEYYNSLGNFSLVVTPSFEANRLPRGDRLSYYMPGIGLVGTGMGEMFYFEPPLPEKSFDNAELAFRFQKQMGNFNSALYFYRGFYKNPIGFDPSAMLPIYPKLNIYGVSIRGSIAGGILWAEGGYFDSRQDPNGNDPYMPNSSLTGMVGFERQVATNLTANIQWQFDYMTDYELFAAQQMPGLFVRDEVKHLLTSRITKLLNSETVTLSAFTFYSPTDEELYFRGAVEYKYTDEVTLTAGGNIFDGSHPNTDFGQFQLNDNLYLKMTYGF